MKELLLIQAKTKFNYLDRSSWIISAPLGLGIIAALTPDDWNITIIDENIRTFSEYKKYDLVGISAITASVNRAYEIAKKFKQAGVPVVMGGPHPTIIPQEPLSLKLADSVVIGEVEGVWKELLEDFEKKELKSTYHREIDDLEGIVHPRRDLFDDYLLDSVYTSRGCVNRCEFCVIPSLYGKKYKTRPFEDVIGEIETLQKDTLFFVDDNLIGDPGNALKLFKALDDMKLNKKWYAQVPITIENNLELIKTAALSGAKIFYIGFESINERVLKKMNKRFNLRNYIEAIKKIRENGIAIVGSFMFGYDGDTESSILETADFINKSGIDAYAFYISQPAPETMMFKRLKKENRIFRTNFPGDWAYYHELTPTFVPSTINLKELHSRINDFIDKLSSFDQERKDNTRNFFGEEMADLTYEWNKNIIETWKYSLKLWN